LRLIEGRNILIENKSLYNRLKIKYLNALCWFITLNFLCLNSSWSQSLVNQIKTSIPDSANSLIFNLKGKEIYSSEKGITIKVKFEKETCVFISIRKDGGILVFSDSSLEKPFLIEKKNFYPFVNWKETVAAQLFVAKEIPDHGFLRITLKNQTILDDLFVCMSFSRQKVLLKK
jgi:hypothetical protein